MSRNPVRYVEPETAVRSVERYERFSPASLGVRCCALGGRALASMTNYYGCRPASLGAHLITSIPTIALKDRLLAAAPALRDEFQARCAP
jgi:hypothetical protein